MKVLVTGAKGFIGKNLVCHLKERENIEVVEFDRDENGDFTLTKEAAHSVNRILHSGGYWSIIHNRFYIPLSWN